MGEWIIPVLIGGVILSAVKWADSLKKEKREMYEAAEQEGMIYMERLEKERKKRGKQMERMT